MRIRTHKKKDFTIISNSTAQDVDLDLDELGFLTRCLSMPEEWEFRTEFIWKNWKIGRNKIWAIFNSLIQKNRCIRVVEKNEKFSNLNGCLSYEIFDEPNTCKERIKELEDQGFKVQHSGNFDDFKKSLRHSENRSPESGSSETSSAYKETDSLSKDKESFLEKNTTTKEETPLEEQKKQNGGGGSENVNLFNSKGEAISMDASEIYSHFLRFNYPTEVIQQAIQEIKQYTTPVNNIKKCLESITLRINNLVKNPTPYKKTPANTPLPQPAYDKQPKCAAPTMKWGDFIKKKELEKNNKEQNEL